MNLSETDLFTKRCAKNAAGLSDRARNIAAKLGDGDSRDRVESHSTYGGAIDFDTYIDEETFAARLNELDCTRRVFDQASDPEFVISCETDEPFCEFLTELISSCSTSRNWMLTRLHNRKDRRIDLGLALPALHYTALTKLGNALAQRRFHPGLALPEIQRRQAEDLSKFLISLCSPVLVTEMHALRMSRGLRGRNSSDRFKDFVVRHTMDPLWVTYFIGEYPVLLHHCRNAIELRINAITEIADRFEADYDQLVEIFDIRSDDQVVQIESGMGDTHQEGRAVAILRFASGLRLVYKPRSLELDVRFQELLDWLSAHGLQCSFRSLKTLDRGAYGWAEFIQTKSCDSKVEVGRFFYRQGAVLAALHMLGGHDMTHENLIASGEHPFYIDVECAYSKSRPIANSEIPRSSYVRRLMMESVASTGMLPSYRQGDTKGAGFVGGGMATVGGQTREGKVPGWINENTDQMQQVLRTTVMVDKNTNMPHLAGVVQNPLTYIEDILKGFEDAYRSLKDSVDELVGTDGPITALMACPSRVLFRATSTYSQCQNIMLHPDSFINGLATSRKLEYMWHSTSDLIPPGVVQSELDQLWQGDIPFFVSEGNSRDVIDHKGRVVACDYFVETGREKISRRLEVFGDADLALQLKLIEQSFRLFCPGQPRQNTPLARAARPHSDGEKDIRTYLTQAAATNAEHILSSAYREGDEIGWIGPMVGAFGAWKFGPTSLGLYDGLCGYCMFYLYMYKVQPRDSYRDTATKIWSQISRDIMRTKISGIKYNGVSPVFLSGYHGAVSVLYVMAHVSAVLGQEYWDNEIADFVLDWIEERIPHDRNFDFMLGGAGAIPVLLECLGEGQRARGLEIATACGHHLVENSMENSAGICWSSEEFPCLGGFAHGTAGMFYSLHNLGRAVSSELFLDAAAKSLAYDRSLYTETLRSWRCLLDGDNASRPFWCHGSAGIALSRILVGESQSDPTFVNECRIARDDILMRGLGGQQCICHGDFGNLEILYRLADFFEEPSLQDLVLQTAAERVSAHLEGQGWQCGINNREIQLKGLLGGTLGISYSLLRLAEPEKVPSVLHLAPPAADR